MQQAERARATRILLRFAGAGLLALAISSCTQESTPDAALDSAMPQDAGTVRFLNSRELTPTSPPFSEAVSVGNLVFLSGQIGNTPGALTLVEGGMPAEARQTMDNIKASLEAHGLSLANVVKCTVMLADMSEWGAFNEIYRSYFTPPYPARSALGANGLALGARVEVECIAAMSGR